MLLNFKLFEKSVSEFSHLDVINRTFIKLQNDKNFLGPYVSQYMAEEHDEFLNFEDEEEKTEEILNSEEFKQWLQYELETRFEDLQDKFELLVDDNNQITLYRAMKVADNYIKKLLTGQVKRIGRYYSYDFDKAEPHWGYNTNTDDIIFEIKINEEYVDWVDTFRLNLEHEYFNEEDEIRLFKNTPVYITNVWWNKEELDKEILQKIQKYQYLS